MMLHEVEPEIFDEVWFFVPVFFKMKIGQGFRMIQSVN